MRGAAASCAPREARPRPLRFRNARRTPSCTSCRRVTGSTNENQTGAAPGRDRARERTGTRNPPALRSNSVAVDVDIDLVGDLDFGFVPEAELAAENEQ